MADLQTAQPARAFGADGWPVDDSKAALSERQWQELFMPTDLLRSKPPLTLVSGPPAAGKSTYVERMAGPDDLVIDMDRESDRLGIDRFDKTEADTIRLLKARNDRLRELARSDAPRAWFTFSGPSGRTRGHFAFHLQPVEQVVVYTPLEECLRRIEETRPRATKDMIDAVYRWHKQFCRRADERIVDGA